MAMKKTLLEIVQEILSDMDSEDVNSISDTLEAEQVARIVESTFYNIVSAREIPEHYQLIRLTSLSDSEYPTHFLYPAQIRRIDKVWYDTSSDGSKEYTEIVWKDPLEFLYLSDRYTSNYDSISDVDSATKYRVGNNKMPEWYTSFDDQYIVFNSYDSSIESTLMASKTRAYGVKYPIFDHNDDAYVPDLDATVFPYLIAEAKSTAMSLLKGGSDPKIEQAARRQKSYIRNDMYRTKRENRWSDFGRT